MSSTEPWSHHIVLTLVDHAGSGLHHSPTGQRMLNVTGRWSTSGTATVPLLTWPTPEAAAQDAETASQARGRRVEARSIGGTVPRHLVPYGPTHAAALRGFLPYGAAAARNLEAERKKLMGYAAVMLAGGLASSNAPSADKVAAMKAAAHQLQLQGIGSGSWVSAAQGLTGKRARDMLARLMDGEVRSEPGMSPTDFQQAMALAEVLAPPN